MSASTRKHSLSLSSIALIAAALIALTAIGFTMFREKEAAAPASTSDRSPLDVQAMISKLEDKLAQDPQNADGWRMLGWSYFETGRYADAAKAYRHAADLAPAKAENWSALGEALVLAGGQGITGEAKTTFEKALAADPKDPRARYFIGAAREQAGDHKGAVADWIALLNDSPPGAPWSSSVRERIMEVARAHNISVDLPAPRSAATEAIPGPTSEQLQSAAGMTPAQQDAMARAMVDRLAARLRNDPSNADGWLRLMRARKVLHDDAGVTQALIDAKAAFANDLRQQAAFDDAAKMLGISR